MNKIKPVLGILPVWLDNDLSSRKQRLKAAIIRYLNHDCEIDLNWIQEYNNFIKNEGN